MPNGKCKGCQLANKIFETGCRTIGTARGIAAYLMESTQLTANDSEGAWHPAAPFFVIQRAV
jgi:hypothetical protein